MEIYQSRWGYHPFSYETHLKLKKLHRWVFEAYRKHCKLIRWCKKREARPKQEPETDPRFTELLEQGERWVSRVSMCQYSKDPETGEYEEMYIDKNDYHPEKHQIVTIMYAAPMIVRDFRESRIPVELPSDVEETELTAEHIDELYEDIFGESA